MATPVAKQLETVRKGQCGKGGCSWKPLWRQSRGSTDVIASFWEIWKMVLQLEFQSNCSLRRFLAPKKGTCWRNCAVQWWKACSILEAPSCLTMVSGCFWILRFVPTRQEMTSDRWEDAVGFLVFFRWRRTGVVVLHLQTRAHVNAPKASEKNFQNQDDSSPKTYSHS